VAARPSCVVPPDGIQHHRQPEQRADQHQGGAQRVGGQLECHKGCGQWPSTRERPPVFAGSPDSSKPAAAVSCASAVAAPNAGRPRRVAWQQRREQGASEGDQDRQQEQHHGSSTGGLIGSVGIRLDGTQGVGILTRIMACQAGDQHQGETQQREADHDGGQHQRLRQRIGGGGRQGFGAGGDDRWQHRTRPSGQKHHQIRRAAEHGETDDQTQRVARQDQQHADGNDHGQAQNQHQHHRGSASSNG
jgi:hypothetical protein